MVNYRRDPIPGGTFFFTVALADRRSTHLTAEIAILRQAFRKAKSERPFDIDAIVILPDHLHAILTLPRDDADFAHRGRRIKTIFTQGLIQQGAVMPTRDGAGRTLWQRRFWEHTIRDESDFERHADYIHYNPVKHGLVSNPAEWPHSSLHRFIRFHIIPPDWANAAAPGVDFGEP